MTQSDVLAKIYNSLRDSDYSIDPGVGVYYIRKYKERDRIVAKLYIEVYDSTVHRYAFTISIKDNEEHTKIKFILAEIDGNLTLYRNIPLLF